MAHDKETMKDRKDHKEGGHKANEERDRKEREPKGRKDDHGEKEHGHTVSGKKADDRVHDNPIKALGTKPGEHVRGGASGPKAENNDMRIGIQAPDAMRF